MGNPKAKKKFGQHFLVNEKVIHKICNDFSDHDHDCIIEIGPGPGILTKELTLKNKPFYIIEKDKDLFHLLEKIVDSNNIYIEDATNFDWSDFLKQRNLKGKNIWLVSNLPYNCSVPLLISFLQIPEIQFMTLMFQKEVADKIFINENQSKIKINSLHCLTTNYFETTKLCSVSPGSFDPPPKVDSTVLSFSKYSEPCINLETFRPYEKFLRTIFQFRRKTLKKNLVSTYNQEIIDKVLNLHNISSSIRAEDLTKKQIQEMFFSFVKF